MRPAAKHAVAHIIIMGDLYLIEQDDIFKLRGITYDRIFPYYGVFPDERTVAYLSAFINDTVRSDVSAFKHRSVFGDPDILSAPFIKFLRQAFSEPDNKFPDFGKNLPGINTAGEKIRRYGFLQIKKGFDSKLLYFVYLRFVFLFFIEPGRLVKGLI